MKWMKAPTIIGGWGRFSTNIRAAPIEDPQPKQNLRVVQTHHDDRFVPLDLGALPEVLFVANIVVTM